MSSNLNEILLSALNEHWAVPHFNISNLEQLHGICRAARKLRAPVMIGVSEGERNFIGLKMAVQLVEAAREEYEVPLFLNGDHTKSVAAARAAIDAGFQSIHIDLSKKEEKENIEGTKETVSYAKNKNKIISIEGELGYLVTESSRIYKEKIIVDPTTFTKLDEAVKFVRLTGIHRLAPAVGNLHGIAANRPKLNYKLIAELRKKLPNTTLVMHGGSGNLPNAFRRAIQAGFNNVHVSTELRLRYRKAIEKALRAHPDETAPYKLMEPVVQETQKISEKYIKIFDAGNRI